MKKVVSLLLVVMLLLSILPTAAFAEEAKDITVYFTNDVHGAYEKFAYAAEIMKDGDLIVDAGDFIQGSVATSLTDGQCMVDIMNAVGYDLAIPGNHEFDFGFDRFLEIVNGEGNTPYISANVWDKVNEKSVLPAYKILEAGGKKIAFVGITTPETLRKSTPTFFQNEKGEWIYDFCNDETGEKLYKVVQDAIDAAKAEGADYVIAIGHLGINEESKPWTSTEVIANTSGLDALIDGHSHSTFTEKKQDKDGKDVLVAQTGTKLVNVGKLTIDADGAFKAELIEVKAGEEDPFDATVAEAVKKIDDEVKAISETVVAKTEVDLTILNPETGKRAVRNTETNLGDLCADAYRDFLKTDVAFVNGGGVRANIAAGDVTYGDVITVHPFGNKACVIEVTGEQILEALEHGASAYPGESGGFLQVSGLEYTINEAIATPVIKDEAGMFVGLKEGAAHRVVDVKIGGKPLDLKKVYTLGSHNYMLKESGDGYTMFKGCKVLQDEIALDNEVLIRYIRDTLKGVIAKDSVYANPLGEGRIKAIYEPFTDVPTDKWYHDYVIEMFKKGVIQGMTQTTFEPEGKLTRAQIAVLLYRMAGEPEVEDLKSFDDVKEDIWYAKAVAWAKKEGLVNGMTEKTFEPDGTLTRAQLVTILYRKAGSPKVEDKASFDDVKADAWYADAVAWAKGAKIVNGMTEKTFEPDGVCTRAQAAKILSIEVPAPAPEPDPEPAE